MTEAKEFMVISLLPYCALVLLALAMAVSADTGEFNYNVTIANSASNYSIGSDMNINAYVAYNGVAMA